MCGLSNAGLGIKQALGQGPSSSSLMKLVRKYRPPSPTHTFSAALDLRLSRPSVNQPKVIKRIRISQRLFAKRNARGRAQEMRSGSSFHFLAPDTPELLIYTVQATRDKRPVGCLNSLVWPFLGGGGLSTRAYVSYCRLYIMKFQVSGHAARRAVLPLPQARTARLLGCTIDEDDDHEPRNASSDEYNTRSCDANRASWI